MHLFNEIFELNKKNTCTKYSSGTIYMYQLDHEFEAQSCQTKDYKIGISCFSTKHAALRRKNKDWSVRASMLTITPPMQESRSGQCVQHYVIKFVSDLRQVAGFLHQYN
jgi:hypothetical protein